MAKKKVRICETCGNQGFYLVGWLRRKVVRCEACEKAEKSSLLAEKRWLSEQLQEIRLLVESQAMETCENTQIKQSFIKNATEHINRESVVHLKSLKEYGDGIMHQLNQFKPLLDHYRQEMLDERFNQRLSKNGEASHA